MAVAWASSAVDVPCDASSRSVMSPRLLAQRRKPAQVPLWQPGRGRSGGAGAAPSEFLDEGGEILHGRLGGEAVHRRRGGPGQLLPGPEFGEGHEPEIGRASCRERVCKYV